MLVPRLEMAFGCTAICQAVDKLDSLRYYLNHWPNADASESNRYRRRLQHFACSSDECPLEVMMYLVDECKVDTATDIEGCLPLHFAAEH